MMLIISITTMVKQQEMTFLIVYLIHVPIVERRVVTLRTHVINASRLCIAMHHVRRNTDTSIRNNVKDELPSYMMKSSSNNHHQQTIVRYAFYSFLHLTRGRGINHAVAR